MKNFSRLLKNAMLGAILLAGANGLNAQRMVDVPNGQNLSDVIMSDTTATGERVDDNTWYVLERNGYYPVSKSLQLATPLQIKTKDGAGAIAFIYAEPNSTGSYPQLIKNNGDITLESVSISNLNGAGNQPKWGGFRAQGENTKVVLKNCYVDWDKACALQIRANGISVTMENCRMGKFGNYKQINGNGRIIDAREYDLNEVVIRNCTFYHLADRIIRNMQGGTINSFIFDHNTGAHIQGFHGTFHMGKVKYCQITNNLILNPKYMGNHPNVGEQTGPAPDSENHYLITADTILAETQFIIHHNNFAYEQDVLDMFAANDSVSKPEVLAPIVATAMGSAAGAASMEEVVAFTSMPELPKEFMYAIFTKPEVIPDNFPDELGLAAIDATYPTTATSYTAAEGGKPLGDLNWFPEFASISSNALAEDVVSVYPNPTQGELFVKIDLDSEATVTISDLSGKTLKTVTATTANEVNRIDVSDLADGLYIYNVTTAKGNTGGNFIITK